MPAPTFDPATAGEQQLLDATTETVGPGTHTLTVDPPESDGQGPE